MKQNYPNYNITCIVGGAGAGQPTCKMGVAFLYQLSKFPIKWSFGKNPTSLIACNPLRGPRKCWKRAQRIFLSPNVAIFGHFWQEKTTFFSKSTNKHITWNTAVQRYLTKYSFSGWIFEPNINFHMVFFQILFLITKIISDEKWLIRIFVKKLFQSYSLGLYNTSIIWHSVVKYPVSLNLLWVTTSQFSEKICDRCNEDVWFPQIFLGWIVLFKFTKMRN